MILFGSIYSADEGNHHYYALIFDMNLVFEKYIARLLRKSLPEYSFNCQAELYLANEHQPIFKYTRTKKRMIPDIIVSENGKSLAIIDTKYKPDLSKGYISNADTYQMLAYSVANESDRAVLLYPKLPNRDQLIERDHCIVLDKFIKERKVDRIVIISGRNVQLFDQKGNILKNLSSDDTQMMKVLLTSQITCPIN
jgi:5-methylcytosine-specific restriction endonuclease McrBC regulatory subunit McrC